MRRQDTSTPLALGICAIAALVALAPAHAQPDPGRAGFELPDRTDAGTWDGTWYYMSRDAHVAVWIVTENGQPRVKLQYLHISRLESFATDWDGQASYRFAGKPATFSFELTERGPNTLRGRWIWELGQGELRRVEKAWVTMYRAGDGRALVMNFEDLERFHGSVAGTEMTYPQVWTLRKASNNQRRWEELPF